MGSRGSWGFGEDGGGEGRKWRCHEMNRTGEEQV
jgi:hypothetical protein